MARGPRPSGSDDVTPRGIPDVTPQQVQGTPDYSLHTLQAVIEMQKTLGALSAKVDRLVDDVKVHGDRIDGLRLKMAIFAGGGAAIGGLIGALVAIMNSVPWDRIFPAG